MITITGNEAEIRFPWPTNDTGRGVLKMMTAQASSALSGHGRQVVGGIRFADIPRTDSGYEFVFTATLVPLEETNG